MEKETINLWEKCEEDTHRHITYKPDWKLSILALNKELGIVSCVEKNVYILLGSKLTYVPNQRL